jgi:hypothetical protein
LADIPQPSVNALEAQTTATLVERSNDAVASSDKKNRSSVDDRQESKDELVAACNKNSVNDVQINVPFDKQMTSKTLVQGEEMTDSTVGDTVAECGDGPKNNISVVGVAGTSDNYTSKTQDADEAYESKDVSLIVAVTSGHATKVKQAVPDETTATNDATKIGDAMQDSATATKAVSHLDDMDEASGGSPGPQKKSKPLDQPAENVLDEDKAPERSPNSEENAAPEVELSSDEATRGEATEPGNATPSNEIDASSGSFLDKGSKAASIDELTMDKPPYECPKLRDQFTRSDDVAIVAKDDPSHPDETTNVKQNQATLSDDANDFPGLAATSSDGTMVSVQMSREE